ncbi:competence protein ComEA [Crossiella equi]|uniref:Competence protein ComEA n=1 Tax=Crossiella equi TaxID=130796 RepID=A0ABS5AD52_9PSEU|nr:ComEA family DNA-binding protein [Crossiella equi]MBP2474144.1 competence protein ComEA [Crossiella equi]
MWRYLSAATRQRRDTAQARLSELAAAARKRTGPDPPPELANIEIIELDESGHRLPARPLSRPPNWFRRLFPSGARGIRWDPGRPAALAVAVVALLAVATTALLVWSDQPTREDAPALATAAGPAAPPITSATTTGPGATLVVSVVGRVTRPGLVTLTEGARVADAVHAAGGAHPDADLSGLNLARRLADGEQVHVGVPPPAEPPAHSQGVFPGGAARVSLNTATPAALDALPGVGPVTAQRIVQWRTKHGRFTSIDQLREIEGIGASRLARLRELVSL